MRSCAMVVAPSSVMPCLNSARLKKPILVAPIWGKGKGRGRGGGCWALGTRH